MAAPVSYWLRLFNFSSETTERNSTKVNRKQDLNILYIVGYPRSFALTFKSYLNVRAKDRGYPTMHPLPSLRFLADQ